MRLTLIGFFERGVRVWIIALLLSAGGTVNAWADTTGKQDFDANCATCHGKDGKGHGPALYVIPGIKPPDLTKLSRNNGGVFPAEQVYQSIDGRAGIPAHSRIDMPFGGQPCSKKERSLPLRAKRRSRSESQMWSVTSRAFRKNKRQPTCKFASPNSYPLAFGDVVSLAPLFES